MARLADRIAARDEDDRLTEDELVSLASAHRDPARSPGPDRFDITREDRAHLALGRGLHHRLGAPLARLQIGAALGTLLDRLPDLRPARPLDALRWAATFRFHALRALPVTNRR
ncbi:hypothetical protein [Streptomyces sp. NPDC004050]